MDSRKKRNREIENKRRQKRRIFTGVLVVLILACVAALGYGVWDMMNRRTIMTFNGERVHSRYFRYLLYTSQDPWGELEQSLVMREAAERHNITLTSDQREQLTNWATSQRAELSAHQINANFITDAQVADLWSMAFYMESLMDIYVPDFEHDEDEFLEILEEFHDMIIAEATNTMVKFIYSNDEDEIRAVTEAFAEYGDFAAAVAAYWVPYEETGLVPVSLGDFIDNFHLWDYAEELHAHEEGEISDIIEEHHMFILMFMYEKDVVDYEMIDQMIEAEREWFIGHSRQQVFMEIMNGWIDDADIEWNERAVERLLDW